MTNYKNYQPKNVNEIIFGNEKSKTMIEEIISNNFPFPFSVFRKIGNYFVWCFWYRKNNTCKAIAKCY